MSILLLDPIPTLPKPPEPTPPYIYRPSPNTSGPMTALVGVVLHGSRSGHAGNPTEGIGTVNYCQTPGTTSYNWLIDTDGTIYELTGWERSAWHAEELNRTHYGLCFAQPTVDDPITDAQHTSARWLLREIHRRAGIPLVHVTSQTQRGLIEHREAEQGQRWAKSDVGYRLDWTRLLEGGLDA